MAKAFDKFGPYPDLAALLSRMQAPSAFWHPVKKGGPYQPTAFAPKI